MPAKSKVRSSRLLRIDWNAVEARYVLVQSRRGKLSLLGAGRQPLASAPEGEGAPTDVAAAIREAVSAYKAGRIPTLRQHRSALVEWEPMSLPPSGDDELPGLVLNQISQQLPGLSEQAAVDFFTGRSAAEIRNVVAVALSPAHLSRINQVVADAGLTASRIGIRALGAASLVRRLPEFAEANARGTILAVDAAGEVVDLTLLQEGVPVLVRTVRLAGDPRNTNAVPRLVQEIRRSFVASGSEGTPETTGRIVLFGQADEWRAATAAIRETLALEVQTIDPFELAGMTVPAELAGRGGFAGLLGMLVDESQGQSPTVDFLHPKRVAPPRDYRRNLLVGAGVAVAAVMGVSLFLSQDLAAIDEQNEDSASQLKDVDGQIKHVEPRKNLTDGVEAWQGGGVHWLDEIRSLSEKLPPSRDIVVMRMSMGPNRDGGGSLTYQGVAREPGAVERMEAAIRNPTHEVQTPKVQERPQDRSYPWEFETTVNILPAAEQDKPEATGKSTKAGESKRARRKRNEAWHALRSIRES